VECPYYVSYIRPNTYSNLCAYLHTTKDSNIHSGTCRDVKGSSECRLLPVLSIYCSARDDTAGYFSLEVPGGLFYK
jgi:hypothetical protein